MGYKAHQGPAGALVPLIGYAGGVTQISLAHAAAPVQYSDTFPTVADADTGTNTGSNWYTAGYPLYIAGAVADDYRCGIRIPNITIPQGATIDTCIVTFYGNNNTINNVNDVVAWALEQADSAAQVTSQADAASRLTSLGTAVNSYLNAAITGSPDNPYTTQELKTILQAIVDRAGWASGNAIQFWTDYVQQGTGGRQAHSYSTGVAGGYQPSMYVEWTA